MSRHAQAGLTCAFVFELKMLKHCLMLHSAVWFLAARIWFDPFASVTLILGVVTIAKPR